jgi:hypothetical protein
MPSSKQVEVEARESPVRFLEYNNKSTRRVAEAGRIDPRGSEKVIDDYSPLILRLGR